MYEDKIRKYKISSEDLREAEVIILDGIVYKDRHHSTENYGGMFSTMNDGDIDKKNIKMFVGCETQDGHLRFYKNY